MLANDFLALADLELSLPASFSGYGVPSCGGSSWSYPGPTGMAVNGQAGPADVVVGLEVYYYAPYTPPSPFLDASLGGDSSCQASDGEVCYGGRCGTPPPEVPGAVLGVSKLLCAGAEQVAQGRNAPDPAKTVDLGLTPPVVPHASVESATLAAPEGAYALDGARIVYSDGGATQLAASYRPFAQSVSERYRGLTGFLPSQASAVHTQTADIGCCPVGSDLYLWGLASARTEASPHSLPPGFAALGALAVACQSYSDLFQMPGGKKLECCLGKRSWQCWGYSPQSEKCDQALAAYCQPLCAGGVCADPVCSCLGSLVAADGVAQCFDSRCAGNPGAYKTAAMTAAACRGKSLSCEEWTALGKYVAPGVPIPSGCTGPAPPSGGSVAAWLEKNPLILAAIVVFLIIVAFAAMYSPEEAAPKLPLGALPSLPPLSEL